MQYEIVIPIEITDNYYNFGIDFWLQQLTATNKETNKDEVIVSLKKLGLSLDNKIIKDYTIVKQKNYITIQMIIHLPILHLTILKSKIK